MPSPADAALCAREPELPGLAGVLDATALVARAGLPPMRQSYLLYKPGTSAVAGLLPEVPGAEPIAWTAMTYPTDRYARARTRPAWASGAIFLDAEQALLVPLALTRKPRAWRCLADAAARAELLSRLGIAGGELELLRYKPGRRIVLRADVTEGPRAVVKLHADEADFARAVAGAAHAERMGGPKVLGTDPERGAVATAWTQGRTLSAGSGVAAFARAGAALATAHAAPLHPRFLRWSSSAPARTAETVAWLLPDLAARVRALAERLPAPPSDAVVPVHGDFSADQIVDGMDGAVIVDWDRAAAGPAARDLGSALAALDLDDLRGTPSSAAAEALLAGYGAAGGRADDAVVAAHRAHALLALAVDGFRARRRDWAEETRAILERLESSVGARPGGAPSGPSLVRALDVRTAGPLLAGATGQGAGELRAELLRLKPGRRALIRYTRPGRPAVLGKLRVKGPDRAAPRLQAALRATGFDGTGGVGVPAVAGRVDELNLWLQEEVAGTPLGALLDAPDAASALRRTGDALAALHAAPPQTGQHWSVQDELAVLARAVAGGAHAELAELAERRLRPLTVATPVGLHRDFYFDQVIVSPDVLWLVDLDLHATGDAAVDVGNFLAHLTELGLRRSGDAERYAPLGTAFLDGYAAARPLPERERIDALHWVSLARHVAIAERFPERRATVPAIAALCRARLVPVQPDVVRERR